jgi:glycerol-3-phosphate dehydrogenase
MNRPEMIRQLYASTGWEVLIIGGGATGLGIAIDAASRGYKTLLVEKNDFAKGTSSRATKLVHGGVRYLAQGNIKLVREALRERGLLLKNAPHICTTAAFILPAYRWYEKLWYGIGLKVYEFMSGSLSLGSTRILNREAVLQLLPTAKKEKLRGGVLYYDGQFDDARLAINMAQTAVANGATVVNYATAVTLLYEDGKITGVQLTDTFTQQQYTVRSKVVINATGVFVDQLLRQDGTPGIVSASQGIHIVLDKQFFPGTHALMIPKTDDGRVLFAIPWHDKVLVGTTDTPINEISEEPVALESEIDFLIGHFNRYHQTAVQRSDVLSVFAGLRPLVKRKEIKNTAALSRDHTIIVSAAQLVTITGGKWTTWRKMAEDAVNRAVAISGLEKKKCVTPAMNIHGHTTKRATENHLRYYGSDAVNIQALMQEPDMNTLIHPQYPFTVAEVVWAVRNEMAQTVEDVLARRVRLLFLDARAAMEAAPTVAAIIAKELNKNEQWQKEQELQFEQVARNYVLA